EAEQQRTIRSNVAVALDAGRQSARRVEAAREASALYRSAVDDQRETLQIGLSTVIDLVLTEEHLTSSLLNEVAAQVPDAQAVAQLRYETGTLLEGGADAAGAIDVRRLTTIPGVP